MQHKICLTSSFILIVGLILILTGSGGVKTTKNKKKNKRRKDNAKNSTKANPGPVIPNLFFSVWCDSA
jgi:hypothetical protein